MTRRSLTSSIVFALMAGAALVVTARTALPGRVPVRVTVPLVVEGNRPYVDVTLRRANGTERIARFLVDSGGGGFLLTEPLARDLGLTWGKTSKEEGAEFATPSVIPQASIGVFPLALTPERVLVLVGETNVVPKAAPGHADGLLPGHILAKYHVVFDYPRAEFTIALPHMLTPEGEAMKMPVSRTGFPRTEIQIDGRTYGMLVDTGASFTMVSEVLLKALGAAHPDWPRVPGGAGEAATLGGTTLETMTLPGATWGTIALPSFGIVSQREGTFEKYMSGMMTAPIIGSLAGNVLKQFRVELDYPNQKLYLRR